MALIPKWSMHHSCDTPPLKAESLNFSKSSRTVIVKLNIKTENCAHWFQPTDSKQIIDVFVN